MKKHVATLILLFMFALAVGQNKMNPNHFINPEIQNNYEKANSFDLPHIKNSGVKDSKESVRFRPETNNRQINTLAKYSDSDNLLLDSLISYRWDTIQNEWVPHNYFCSTRSLVGCRGDGNSSKIVYNQKSNIISEAYYSFDSTNNDWNGSMKYEYAYDANGNQTLNIWYHMDTTAKEWVIDYKNESEYTYGANGNQKLDISYHWDATAKEWVVDDENKSEYTYDANGNLTLGIWYNWDTTTNDWDAWSKYKHEYTYDANGNQTVRISYYWDTSANDWVVDSKHEYAYDANGNQTLYSYFNWDTTANDWYGSSKDEYAYDANGNQTLIIWYHWDTTAIDWVGINKYEKAYDANGNQILDILYYWDTKEWVVGYKNKSEYTYDANGNQTEEFKYIWDTAVNDWGVKIKYEWYYSEQTASTLSVDATSLSIAPDANSTATFNLSSIIDWSITSSESWLSVNTGSGTGDAEITLTAEENVSTESRTATITVSGTDVNDHTIIITQSGSTVGISNLNYSDITIYPNPTDGIITIDFQNPLDADIEIYNTNGSLIYSKHLQSTQQQIDLSAYPKGLYFVKVRQDGVVKVGKVVLE